MPTVLARLAETATQVAAASDPAGLCTAVWQTLGRTLGAACVIVAVPDRARATLRAHRADAGDGSVRHVETSVDPATSPLAHCFRSGAPIVTAAHGACGALVAVPLTAGGTVVGVLAAELEAEREATERETQILAVAAGSLAARLAGDLPSWDGRVIDLLRTALEVAPVGIVVLDADLGVRLWNQTMADLSGRPAAEAEAAASVADLIRADVAAGRYGDASFDQVWRIISARYEARQPFSEEQHWPDVDRHVVVHGNPAPDGGWIVSCTDISRLKRQEADLQRTRDDAARAYDELHAALRAIPHSVVIYDQDFNFRAWNSAWLGLHNYTEEQMREMGGLAGLLRHEVYDLKSFEGQTYEEVYEQYRTFYQSEKFNRSIQHWPMRDKYIDRRTARSASGGWVSVIVDITDYVKAREELERAKEAAESAARAKAEFLANMSHEIRTPLNAIIGFTQLTLKSTLNERQREHLTLVESSSQLLLRILNDILDFSRIDAGRLELERVPFDLDEVLRNFIDLTSTRMAAPGVELLVSVGPGVPGHLVGDPLRLAQILFNFGSNAAKFTEHGTIALRVALVGTEAGRATLSFAMSDTGVGMTPRESKSLFQAFSQADTSTTRRFGGSGLGLAISKALTDLMGGTIDVESAKGRGSTFCLTVTLDLPDPATHPGPAAPSLDGLRVLVVDDNPTVRLALAGNATQLGAAAHAVPSLLDAEAELAHSALPYDVVLIDHGLADLEAIRRMRRALHRRPPVGDAAVDRLVLVLNGALPSTQRLAGSEAAADGLMPKAATLQQMRWALMSAYGERRAPAAAASVTDQAVRAALGGMRVLVVEDNEVNQLVMRSLLEQVGVVTTIAENGRRAVDLMADGGDGAFDAVLMDIQMPEMDGLEATALIRSNPLGRGIPIVAVSAAAFESDRQKSREAGMVEHLSKPVDPHLLYDALARHTGRRARAGADVMR